MGIPNLGSLLLILLLVVLVFGTKKLKGMGGDLGGAIKGFRKAMKDDDAPQPPQLTDSSDNSSVNQRQSSHDHQQ